MQTYKPQFHTQVPQEKSEAAIQAETFMWHKNTYPGQRKQLFMVFNNPKNKIQGSILLGMGLVKGISDLIYLANDGSMWFMECKLPKETQSADQIKFEHLVKSLGHHYHIFHSKDEFKFILKDYLL